MVLDDVRERNAFADQFQKMLHRNATPGDTWFAKVNAQIDDNAVSHHQHQAKTWRAGWQSKQH
jgi:hypothetical protein